MLASATKCDSQLLFEVQIFLPISGGDLGQDSELLQFDDHRSPFAPVNSIGYRVQIRLHPSKDQQRLYPKRPDSINVRRFQSFTVGQLTGKLRSAERRAVE